MRSPYWRPFARLAAAIAVLMATAYACTTPPTDPTPRWSPAVDRAGQVKFLCDYLRDLSVTDLDLPEIEGNLRVRASHAGIPDNLEQAVRAIHADLPDNPTARKNQLAGRKETSLQRCRDAGWTG